jgi:N-acetyl-gamma-glutamyl-phosphate reductase common form
MSIRTALIGARGHTGSELLALIQHHPELELVLATSRARAGEAVDHHPELTYQDSEPDVLADVEGLEAIILALPNGLAAPWVAAIEQHCPKVCVVDLSADYRFDDAWVYGQPQTNARQLAGARRIANPGCYATAMQLALWPARHYLAGRIAAFGISGYSGAGTKPSPRNDPKRLADNLMPYALGSHVHQAEVARHSQCALHFMPHVAPWFRGLSVTLSMPLTMEGQRQDWPALYQQAYAEHPFVRLSEAPPELRDSVGTHHCLVGGLALDEGHLAVVSTLDNLLKGAASQAIENLNLAFELPHASGLQP